MATKQPGHTRRRFPRWTAAGWGAFAAVLSAVVAAAGLFLSTQHGSSATPPVTAPATVVTPTAVSEAATSVSSMTTLVAAPEDHYLSDLLSTQHKGCGRPGPSDVTIAGVSYPRSITIVAQKCTGGGTNYVEYTIPQGCQTFSAELGLPDTSADDDVALIEVSTDAGQRQTITTHRNTGKHVTLPLAGAFHVRLTMQNLASAGLRDVTAAFGDAKFACAGGDLNG